MVSADCSMSGTIRTSARPCCSQLGQSSEAQGHENAAEAALRDFLALSREEACPAPAFDAVSNDPSALSRYPRPFQADGRMLAGPRFAI
jgi:hypothetical protein